MRKHVFGMRAVHMDICYPEIEWAAITKCRSRVLRKRQSKKMKALQAKELTNQGRDIRLVLDLVGASCEQETPTQF